MFQGCTRGSHTDETPQVEAPKPSASANLKMTASNKGKEVYSSQSTLKEDTVPVSSSTPTVEEEEEDLDAPVKPGTICRHKGCGTAFVSDEVNRKGGGEGTICTYHPAPVRFRCHSFLE